MRAAIVGCGAIAQVHAKSILELGHELVALADINADHLIQFSEKFGGRTYSSLEEMLENENVEIVHICTPHDLHVPMAIYALEHGVHVIMEKPPVITGDQLDQLRQAVARENEKEEPKKLGVCLQNRYNPSVAAARKLLATDECGKLIAARGYVTWHRGAEYYSQDNWHGTLAHEGGGVLINQTIHTLDLVHSFVGQTPVNVDAVIANHRLKTEIEVEDTVSALINYPDTSVSFYATNDYVVSNSPLIELNCEKMDLRVEGDAFYCRPKGGFWQHVEVNTLQTLGKSYWGGGHLLCIKDFYESIQEDRHFQLEFSDVEETTRLMLMIYASGRQHRTVGWEEKL